MQLKVACLLNEGLIDWFTDLVNIYMNCHFTVKWMGYEWKTEGKNYKVPLKRCSKLRKKINTKL